MAYNPQNPNGQATMANSAPVTIASNQSAVPVSLSGDQAINVAQVNGNTTTTVANGTQAVGINDGTNTANVLAPGTANSTGDALLTAITSQSQTFSISSVTTGTAYDVGNYASVKVQVTTLYTGTAPTITFQCSNDNSNWYSTPLVSVASLNGASQTSTTGTGMFSGPLMGRYFRLNFTGAYSSNTTTGTIVFSTGVVSLTPVTSSGVSISSMPGEGSTGSAVPSTALYMAGLNAGGNLNAVNVLATSADALANSNSMNVNANGAVYNGSTWDRVRSAANAAGTSGTGLLGAGVLGYNGTNYEALTVNSTTYTSKYGLDVNLLGTLGTAFTTAGVVNVQGVSGGTAVPVTSTPAVTGTIYSGQYTVTSSAAAIASSQALTQGVTVEAKSSNSVSVYVGPSGVTSTTGLELPPGASITLPVNNVDLVYAICSTSSQVLTYIGA